MRSQSAPSALSVPSPANICTRKEPILLDELYWIRRRPTLPGRFQPSTISVLRLNFCVRDGNKWIPQAIVTGNQTEFGFFAAAFLVPSVRPSASRLPCTFSASAFLRTLKTAQACVPLGLTKTSFHTRNFSLLLPTNHWLSFRSVRFCFVVPASNFARSFEPRSRSRLSQLHSPLSKLHSLLDQALDLLVSSSSIRYRTSTDDLSTLSSSRGLTCFIQWQFYSPGGLHA